MIYKVTSFDIAMAAAQQGVAAAVALLCRAAGHTQRLPLPRTDLAWSIADNAVRRALLRRWMVSEVLA